MAQMFVKLNFLENSKQTNVCKFHSPKSILSYQFIYKLVNVCNAVFINSIKNEFSFANGIYNICFTQNSKMLGSNRLLKAQFYIKFSNSNSFMFINCFKNQLSEFMIKSP